MKLVEIFQVAAELLLEFSVIEIQFGPDKKTSLVDFNYRAHFERHPSTIEPGSPAANFFWCGL